MPLDQITITVSPDEFEPMIDFYTATLQPLGYSQIVNYESVVAFGLEAKPDLWITRGVEDIYEREGRPLIVAFAAASQEQVDGCYRAAVKTRYTKEIYENSGRTQEDEFRQLGYAARLSDPKGNLVEIWCREEAKQVGGKAEKEAEKVKKEPVKVESA
ncbi:hypothetical protein MMC13_002536 [Lambiella insularis]|nr:hypothetical protein [Lambiella insularis]